jgi:hypothetical protein
MKQILVSKNRIVFLSIVLVTIFSYGQNIKKHQWENRVLLIFSEDKNSQEFKNQIEILKKEKQGIKERKLIIYQFSKNQFTTNFNSVWRPSNLSIKKYVNRNEDFKIILIGLDGGKKLAQNTILTTEKLFSIIDGMPMRKREVKNNR